MTRVYFKDKSGKLGRADVSTTNYALAIKTVRSEPSIKPAGAVLAVIQGGRK